MEKVPIEDFLAELDDALADNTIGAEHPVEMDLRMALHQQIRKYTMQRMRTLLKGQTCVYLPDAVEEQTGTVLTREDWEVVEATREDFDR